MRRPLELPRHAQPLKGEQPMNTNTATEYRNLPLAVLTESATPTRAASSRIPPLQELAESIRSQGVLSPLLQCPAGSSRPLMVLSAVSRQRRRPAAFRQFPGRGSGRPFRFASVDRFSFRRDVFSHQRNCRIRMPLAISSYDAPDLHDDLRPRLQEEISSPEVEGEREALRLRIWASPR